MGGSSAGGYSVASVPGAYVLPGVDAGDLSGLADVIARSRDRDIGVTDASLVWLADRYDTRDVLTLDHRHFGVIRPLAGGRFRLLPTLRRR